MKKAPAKLSDLIADPANRRRHPERNLAMVVEALHAVGAARSIVIDEGNVVLAGNGVAAAAARAGITKVRTIEAKGDELIAVRRTGLTDAQKRALALYDNRTAELAEWNPEQLRADQAAGFDLAPFWSEQELNALLATDTFKAGKTDPDAVPEERATTIRRGDLFELGAHRLLCGDATSAADVARLFGAAPPFLMVTDPPYGVDYDPDWRNRDLGEANRSIGLVTNDDRVDWTPAWQLFTGDVAYVWHASLFGSEVLRSLAAAHLVARSQIIWRKQHFVISRGHYHWQHETCLYACRDGRSAKWSGDRSQTTVWEVTNGLSQGGPRQAENDPTGHSTQKPVECMRRPIQNHGGRDDAVYDPFLGSGSTLIACEQLERACRAIELKPSYVQVAIDRWEAFTGERAVKAGAGKRRRT